MSGLASINNNWQSRGKIDVLPDGTTLNAAAASRVMLEVDHVVASARARVVVAPWVGSVPSTRLVARWQHFDY